MSEPLLGWRLWRVGDGGLASWGVRYHWRPGPNDARCLGERRCPVAPGEGCNCGFWSLFSPLQCLRYARDSRTERSTVLGVVRAWGEIAVHGDEGFRAQHAAVVCLFTDWVWGDEGQWVERRQATWWERLRQALIEAAPGLPPAPGRVAAVQRLAQDFGVPLVSLEAALNSGLLGELGATERMRTEVAQWVAGGRIAGKRTSSGPG